MTNMKPEEPDIPIELWQAGDVVTRRGDDEYEIIENDEGLIRFRCIKEPSSGWIKQGEENIGLANRYSFVRTRISP